METQERISELERQVKYLSSRLEALECRYDRDRETATIMKMMESEQKYQESFNALRQNFKRNIG